MRYPNNIHDSIVTFRSAKSVEDIKRMNIAFLRGDMQATAWHLGPLKSESAPLVDKLIQLNELGYITTCSQPGGRFGSDCEQRFYVDGVLPRKFLSMFIHHMYSRCPTAFILVINEEFPQDEYKLLSNSNLYWVTKEKEKYLTHVPEYTYSCEEFISCHNVYREIVNDYITVYIMDTRWCNEDTEILDTAIDVLKELNEILHE